MIRYFHGPMRSGKTLELCNYLNVTRNDNIEFKIYISKKSRLFKFKNDESIRYSDMELLTYPISFIDNIPNLNELLEENLNNGILEKRIRVYFDEFHLFDLNCKETFYNLLNFVEQPFLNENLEIFIFGLDYDYNLNMFKWYKYISTKMNQSNFIKGKQKLGSCYFCNKDALYTCLESNESTEQIQVYDCIKESTLYYTCCKECYSSH